MPSSISLLNTTDILIITETWLLSTPPSRSKYPTNWTQHHLYGPPLSQHLGSRGITILIHPDIHFPITFLPAHHNIDNHLSFTIGTFTFHCLYLPPSLSDENAITILQHLPRPSSTTTTIFCGDFNARNMQLGDTRTTVRGTMLFDWMSDHDIICLNQTQAYGIPTYEHFTTHIPSSIIDLFLTDNPSLQADLTVHSSLSLHSPHRAVTLSIPIPVPSTHHIPFPRRTWNLSRLQEKDVLELYQNTLSDNLVSLHTHLQHDLRHPQSSPPNIDLYTDQLNHAIYAALDKSLGSKPPKARNGNSWFWTNHLQQLVDRREHLFKQLRHTPGLQRLSILQDYQVIKKQIKLEINRRKRETWREFIDKLSNQDYALTTRQIKAMRSKRKVSHTFTSPDGPQAAADVMANTLAQIYNGSIRNQNLAPPPPNYSTPFNIHSFTSPFSLLTLQSALSRLPSRKAPGVDHLRAEMFKSASSVLLPVLSSLFSLCWMWSYTPSPWRQAQVVPIFKKGDPSNPSNYRPISLTSHLRKLMEHCIINLLPENSPP
jgi:hypothetical protein